MRHIRTVLIAIAAFLGSFGVVGHAGAQAWPTKPIRMIVTFPAGGGTDIVARVVAPKLSEVLGQPVVVENRPGAGGIIGTEIVAKAAPDGYTLLLGAAGATTIAPHIFGKEKVSFDVLKDLQPITLVATVPFIVTVNPAVPVKSVRELIAYAKANPNKLNFGSSGNGGAPHLAGELFKRMAGIEMVHVPYKGLAPAITDLLGGRIQLVFADIGLVKQHIKSGRLRALAVTSDERSPIVPEIPTVAESGLPGYRAATWYGVIAPAGMPPAIVQRLSGEMQKIMAMPDVRAQLVATGNEPANMTMKQFGDLVHDDYAKWQKLIGDIGGIKVN